MRYSNWTSWGTLYAVNNSGLIHINSFRGEVQKHKDCKWKTAADQLYSTFNPVIKLAPLNKKNLLMTQDVYVRTWLKREAHCYYFYKLSYKAADVIRLGIFSENSAGWCIFFLEMQQYFFLFLFFFLVPCSTTNGKKTSGRHFFWLFGGLSRQHNGTYRFQMWRRSVKQRGLLLFIPFKRT